MTIITDGSVLCECQDCLNNKLNHEVFTVLCEVCEHPWCPQADNHRNSCTLSDDPENQDERRYA